MPWDGVLVRFGEIGIKSAPVRSRMVEALRRNLLSGMERGRVEGDVLRRGSRLWIVGPDVEGSLEVAAHTFGVVSASPCRLVPARMDELSRVAAELALPLPWASFAVRARREGQHAFSSQDVQAQVGSAVFTAAQAAGRAPVVDLEEPDLEVHVDIRAADAYVHTRSRAGPGGIPSGTQGRVLALLSDEASFVAAWLLMRRGCEVLGLHAGDAGSVPVEAVERLQDWGFARDVEVLPVCTGKVTKEVLLAAAESVAAQARCQAIATGDTLASPLVAAPAMPVLRPVCGLDAGEYASVRDRMRLAGLQWPEPVLAPAAAETVASLLAMRRTVTV